jgi:hypothetical protein
MLRFGTRDFLNDLLIQLIQSNDSIGHGQPVSHLLRASREVGRSFSSGQQLEATSDR